MLNQTDLEDYLKTQAAEDAIVFSHVDDGSGKSRGEKLLDELERKGYVVVSKDS